MNQTPHPPPSSQPGPPPAGYRQLRRSRTERMLAGVCGGLADYLRVDPTLVRVGFAVLAIITWGVALLAYLVAWLLMPEA
jgi:phage shock protein C